MDTTYIICYRDIENGKCMVQPAFKRENINTGIIADLMLEILEVCSRANLQARLEHWKQALDTYTNGYNLKRE